MPVGLVVVNVPPQTVADALATVSPVGSVSVNATPVSGSTLAPGFVMVNVSDVVAFSAIVAGLKTLAIEGGASTFTLADAVPPVPPLADVTLPVVLFCIPADVPFTFTENVQDPLAFKPSPLRLITLVPCVAVTVPAVETEPATVWQPVVKPLGVAITRPAGSVSLKPMPVSVVVLLLF